MNEPKDGLPLTEIHSILSEAETYNKNMEDRGFHTGGPGDIEGVYDSRIYLLTCAVRALLDERRHPCCCMVKHEGPCQSPRSKEGLIEGGARKAMYSKCRHCEREILKIV